jgi:hypothetical protein
VITLQNLIFKTVPIHVHQAYLRAGNFWNNRILCGCPMAEPRIRTYIIKKGWGFHGRYKTTFAPTASAHSHHKTIKKL